MTQARQSNLPDKSKLPIMVHFGYPWPDKAAGIAPEDPVWRFVRRLVAVSADSLAKIQAGRQSCPLPIRINRLRAMHGGSVLETLLRRIRRSDILIFDITGGNPNVLLEIGMALACKGTAGAVFIFQEAGRSGKSVKAAFPPSDLQGYFFTRYRKVATGSSVTHRLVEPQGFIAALRSRLIESARERGLWRDIRRTMSNEVSAGFLVPLPPLAGPSLQKAPARRRPAVL